MMDGVQVRFGADWIHCYRDYSDAALERAIDAVFRRYRGNFRDAGIERPTVAQYRNGKLWDIRLPGLHNDGLQSVQADVERTLAKHSDRMKIKASKTAGKVFVTHDDGYSRMCGSGMSAVGGELSE
jgi:hypothetical protein